MTASNINEVETELRDFLKLKKKYLTEILDITKATRFKDSIDDIQIFIGLTEKREKLLAEIKTIDFEISLTKYNEVFKNESAEVKNLEENIENLIEDIVMQDNIVHEKADAAFLMIQEQIDSDLVDMDYSAFV